MQEHCLEEQLISAWVRLTGILKNTRITKGMVYNDDLKTVVLYQTVDGRMQKYATTRVNEDGSYGFALNPETPGFYSIGGDESRRIF